MRTMVNKTTGQKLNVISHVILKNFWEYYVLEINEENKDIAFCYVVGFENELGDVSFREIKPYILNRTNNLNDVLPAPNFEWVN